MFDGAGGSSSISLDESHFLSPFIKELSTFFDGKGFVTTLMYPETTLGNGVNELFNSIYTLIFGVAIGMIVLKTVYKAFQTYVLGDNDPSQDPIELLKKMIQAIITAFAFNSVVYYLLYSVVAGLVSSIMTVVFSTLWNMAKSMDTGEAVIKVVQGLLQVSAGNGVNGLLLLIFLISMIILYFMFFLRSCELAFLRIGFPLACVGIIDSDYGIFKPYTKKFIQAATTIVVQMSLMFLAWGIFLSPGADASSFGFSSVTNSIFALCFLWTSFSVPKVIQEFTLWGGGGSGAASTVNMAANVTRLFRSTGKS